MTEEARTSTTDPFLRAAGLGGLGFLTAVIAENVMRQPQPMPNATVQEIATYYQSRPDLLAFSQSLFVIAIPCLLLFAIGTARRLRSLSPQAEPWGIVGAVASAMMTATFGATMALDVVLVASAATLVEHAATTLLLWRLKVAFFTVNLVALSTGVLGFGMGCRLAKLGPPWLARAAVVAGLVGLSAAFPMRAVVGGSPWGALGLLSFVCWLVLVGVVSRAHLRAAR